MIAAVLILGALCFGLLWQLQKERENHRAEMDQMNKRLMAALKSETLIAEIMDDDDVPKPVRYVDDAKAIELTRAER